MNEAQTSEHNSSILKFNQRVMDAKVKLRAQNLAVRKEMLYEKMFTTNVEGEWVWALSWRCLSREGLSTWIGENVPDMSDPPFLALFIEALSS